MISVDHKSGHIRRIGEGHFECLLHYEVFSYLDF